MRLAQIVFQLGFGTRRGCDAMVRDGRVAVAGTVIDDPDAVLAPVPHAIEVDGASWPVRRHAVVMLHKPAGTECSRAPGAHVPVLSLLPPPLRQRGVQPVGRLDADTTGLLLLTDDGPLLHRLTSPRRHVPKVYAVACRQPVDDALCTRLRAGVVLRDDPAPARALACERCGPHALRLTIDEGRYHQVKRMVAAAGNRVAALHRIAFGPLALPEDLPPGAWRWLDDAEVAALHAAAGLAGGGGPAPRHAAPQSLDDASAGAGGDEGVAGSDGRCVADVGVPAAGGIAGRVRSGADEPGDTHGASAAAHGGTPD